MVLLLEQQEQEMQRCSPNLVKYQPVMMWEQFANNLCVNIWSFLPCTRPQKLRMKQDVDAE